MYITQNKHNTKIKSANKTPKGQKHHVISHKYLSIQTTMNELRRLYIYNVFVYMFM